MNGTAMIKEREVKRVWYLVDAKNKILGRLAARVASILRGKHKPIFTPSIDTGDGVVVINAKDVRVTGRKLKDKIYTRYSGYPSGLREISLEEMLKKNSAQVIKLAVQRMLPLNSLGRRMIKRLRVYKDDKFPQVAQKPVKLEV